MLKQKGYIDNKMKKGFTVALALGGGGARGFAHIGVIRAFNSHLIPIDIIVGTSMGAIVGALYCLKPDINFVENKLLELVSRPEIKKLEAFFTQVPEENQRKFIFKKLLSKIKNLYLWNLHSARKWLMRTEPIYKVLEEIFDDKKFSDFKIPFFCIAVDLNSAAGLIIKEGKILNAVVASSSVPGVFPPLKQKEQLLVDGGILSSVPARQARIQGADFVIGVDLTPSHLKREPLTGLDVIHRADWVRTQYLKELNLKYCDIVIKPETDDVSWSAFSQGPFCIQQGEIAALRYVEKIKQTLIKKKRFYFLKRLFLSRRKYVD